MCVWVCVCARVWRRWLWWGDTCKTDTSNRERMWKRMERRGQRGGKGWWKTVSGIVIFSFLFLMSFAVPWHFFHPLPAASLRANTHTDSLGWINCGSGATRHWDRNKGLCFGHLQGRLWWGRRMYGDGKVEAAGAPGLWPLCHCCAWKLTSAQVLYGRLNR